MERAFRRIIAWRTVEDSWPKERDIHRKGGVLSMSVLRDAAGEIVASKEGRTFPKTTYSPRIDERIWDCVQRADNAGIGYCLLFSFSLSFSIYLPFEEKKIVSSRKLISVSCIWREYNVHRDRIRRERSFRALDNVQSAFVKDVDWRTKYRSSK